MNKPSQPVFSVALVIGAGSKIATSIIEHLIRARVVNKVIAISRTGSSMRQEADDRLEYISCDYSEASISRVCDDLKQRECLLTYVFVCNGILHGPQLSPEKRLEDISARTLEQVLHINTVIPMLWLAKLTPLLKGKTTCRVVVFSARVGSISDNRSGGWYAYRASKAALNMLIKTTALELKRRAPNVKLIAFHPGTTDTELSKPFHNSVPRDKLFTPDFVAGSLISILQSLHPESEEEFVDWSGKPVPW